MEICTGSPFDQCLDTFGLVAAGQLVCCIYFYFDLAASCLFH